MNLPTKPRLNKEEQKALAAKNLIAKEKIHSLVVKIISWKFGILEGASVMTSNKITKNEWVRYRKHILSISKIETVEKIKSKLDETHTSIQNHGGFE